MPKTEADWLSATTVIELDIYFSAKKQHRKWRLFGVACCRRAMNKIADRRVEPVIEIAERFAECLASWDEVKKVRRILTQLRREVGGDEFGPKESLNNTINACAEASGPLPSSPLGASQKASFTFAAFARYDSEGWERAYEQENREQLILARDIFGNPFRPVAFDPAWHSPTATAIASRMYESRDFAAMPILADALEEGGCTSADILLHCRQPGVHVRGCWVVDLVLGKM